MATDDKDKKEETMSGSGFGSMSLYNSDLWKRAKERIDAMPEGKEKERAKFLLAQDYAGLKDILGADVASSEAMINTAMPEGRQAGSVYVAANPLEFLSSALRQGFGAKGRRNSMDALKQLSADQAEARSNIQFPGAGGGQAQPQGNHNMPVAQFAAAQAEANKPTLDSLTSQNPGLNQGLSDITQQAMQPAAQVGRAVERRQNVREQGGTPPPVGQGVAGQAKLATGLRGASKPDLSRYGAQVANAGMGQQTARPEVESRPFTLSGMQVPQAITRDKAQDIGSLFGAGIRPDQLSEEKQSLYELLKRNRRY